MQSHDQTPDPLLLTLKEAAKRLALSERTVWQLQADGAIAAVRIGRALRFRTSDIQKFIETL